MAGLEPAWAYYGPTDFKSVASTIPPHRRISKNAGFTCENRAFSFILFYHVLSKKYAKLLEGDLLNRLCMQAEAMDSSSPTSEGVP